MYFLVVYFTCGRRWDISRAGGLWVPARPGRLPRKPKTWNILGDEAYHLAGGCTMYCDRCGTQLTTGAQFCTKWGKAIVGGGAATAPATGHGMGQATSPTGAYDVAAGGAGGGAARRAIHSRRGVCAGNGDLRCTGGAGGGCGGDDYGGGLVVRVVPHIGKNRRYKLSSTLKDQGPAQKAALHGKSRGWSQRHGLTA